MYLFPEQVTTTNTRILSDNEFGDQAGFQGTTKTEHNNENNI